MSSGPGPTSPAQPPKDFFVSYTGRDRTWAEWIAFTLEEAGYTTVIQAWDSRPGMNFVAMMNNATKQTEQTIAVLSGAYLESEFGFAEWAAAFRRDPTGSQRRLVPVLIETCDVQGLLGPIVSLDLVGLDEAQAKEQLLAGIKPERAKPLHTSFPGSTSPPKSGALVRERPLFPPSLPPLWNIPYPRNPYFLGREEVLDQLTTALRTGQPTALSQPAKDVHLQAISGLGGIGKTHVALEYAYRYRSDYQAVLWVQADTHESLTSSFVTLATLLDLPEKRHRRALRSLPLYRDGFK
jgi:TIR domain